MTSTEYQALAVHVRSVALLAAYRELLRDFRVLNGECAFYRFKAGGKHS